MHLLLLNRCLKGLANNFLIIYEASIYNRTFDTFPQDFVHKG